MDNQQKTITQIENKIKNTQAIINQYELELNNWKSTLLTLAQQLEEIKTIMKNNIKKIA